MGGTHLDLATLMVVAYLDDGCSLWKLIFMGAMTSVELGQLTKSLTRWLAPNPSTYSVFCVRENRMGSPLLYWTCYHQEKLWVKFKLQRGFSHVYMPETHRLVLSNVVDQFRQITFVALASFWGSVAARPQTILCSVLNCFPLYHEFNGSFSVLP